MAMPAVYQMGKTSKYKKYVGRHFHVRERETLSIVIGSQKLQQGLNQEDDAFRGHLYTRQDKYLKKRMTKIAQRGR